MDEPLDARARRIFDVALDLAPNERERYLDSACGPDAHLRGRVRTLLDQAEREDPFLSLPTVAGRPGADHAATPEQPGHRIGPYKLLELIGEGGFGTVFMAEQTEPVRRRVALKVIKLGMDTRAVVARFEQERQALALMDHPNIAKVLDAGATQAGRPYFVMELVKGRPITAYCDEAQMSIPERLELFTQVCRAVQHAHTKGVIHRDIKPGNILVAEHDGHPVCKVIDFGIAKATQQPLTEKTVFTEFRQLIGTPEYMSPEQAAGSLDIDTRSDVYSLGVLLYELLAGVTPLDPVRLRSAAYAEIQRIIREVDPPAPSTRLSQASDKLAGIAATRRTEPGKLGPMVRGELDWIVMRALEKDRARRYDSPGNLAADVQRFLDGRPVEAAPPGAVYRLNKFIARHRAPVAAAAAVATALVVGLGAALWQARIASTQRDAARLAEQQARAAEAEARARRDETERIASFQASQLRGINAARMGEQLRRDLLAGVRARLTAEGATEARISAAEASLGNLLDTVNLTDVALESLNEQVFVRALSAIDAQFSADPLTRARLQLTLGDTMVELGLHAGAETPITSALAIRATSLGDDAPETLVAEQSLANLHIQRGDLAAAEAVARQNLERRRRVLGAEHTDTIESLNMLASVFQAQRRLAEAEPLFRQALESARRLGGPDSDMAVVLLNNVSSILLQQRRYVECEPIAREAHERMSRVFGPDDPRTLYGLANVGLALMGQDRPGEAEPILREVLERRRRVQGDSHYQTVASLMDLGLVLRAQGRFTDAEPIYREVLARRLNLFGPNNAETLRAMNNLGALLISLDRLDEAEPILRTTLERRRALLSDSSVATLQSCSILGRVVLKRGRPAEAAPLFREAIQGFTSNSEFNKDSLADAHCGLGACLSALGDYPAAEQAFVEGLRIYDSMPSPPQRILRLNTQEFIALYQAWDKAEPGKGHAAKAEQLKARLSPPPPH